MHFNNCLLPYAFEPSVDNRNELLQRVSTLHGGVITSYHIYNLTNYDESQGDNSEILASQQLLKQVPF